MTRSRANRVRIVLLACVGVAAVILSLMIRQPWRTTAAPPTPDLSTVHPKVAIAVRSESDAVLQSPSSADSWGRYGMLLMAHGFTEEALRRLLRRFIIEEVICCGSPAQTLVQARNLLTNRAKGTSVAARAAILIRNLYLQCLPGRDDDPLFTPNYLIVARKP